MMTGSGTRLGGCSAHLSGWARIETHPWLVTDPQVAVAPTFRGGRGLKHDVQEMMHKRLA